MARPTEYFTAAGIPTPPAVLWTQEWREVDIRLAELWAAAQGGQAAAAQAAAIAPVTPHLARITSGNVVIPAGSRGFGIIVFEGTATVAVPGGGTITLPETATYDENDTTAVAITVTPGSASDVFVVYNS